MAKMSPEERQSRRDRVAAEALESVAKSEQFNFRVDAETIKQLYAIAAEQRKPVGALVREWISDRLHQEQASPSSVELMQEIHEFRQETVACLRAMYQNFASMHSPTMSQSAVLPHPFAETVPMTTPCPVAFAKIPKSELARGVSSLRTTKPGFYEVPDWIVEHFKNELQAR